MAEENKTMVSKEMKTENITEAETENAKEVGIENCEEGKREVKKKELVDTTFTEFEAGKPEARPEVEVTKSVRKKYCFISTTSFNVLKDDYELENDSVFTKEVSQVLADPSYITRIAQGHSDLAHDVFSKRDT